MGMRPCSAMPAGSAWHLAPRSVSRVAAPAVALDGSLPMPGPRACPSRRPPPTGAASHAPRPQEPIRDGTGMMLFAARGRHGPPADRHRRMAEPVRHQAGPAGSGTGSLESGGVGAGWYSVAWGGRPDLRCGGVGGVWGGGAGGGGEGGGRMVVGLREVGSGGGGDRRRGFGGGGGWSGGGGAGGVGSAAAPPCAGRWLLGGDLIRWGMWGVVAVGAADAPGQVESTPSATLVLVLSQPGASGQI